MLTFQKTSNINPLRANPTKWSNTLNNSSFGHFVILALKELMNILRVKFLFNGSLTTFDS